MRLPLLPVLLCTALVACGNTDRPLRDLQSAGGGPDEFQVIPVGALEIPDELSLPEPTPGGTNLTDPTPKDDAIRALGGNPSAQVGGVPASDGALVTQSSRYGVDPTIRATLASEDEARLERARLSNVLNPLGRDRYFPAYAGQVLDPFAEAARLRAMGIAVPDIPEEQ